jgi:transglutaminase superfamily protein
MGKLIRAALNDPGIQAIASQLKARAASLAKGESGLLACDWMWVKEHIKFESDEQQTRRLLNEGDNFELLVSPPVLIRNSPATGDCDDFTMLVLSLASAQGFPVRIVTLECDRRRPGEYSHVYGAAQLPNGMWCPLDASHGEYPGWEVPARDVRRRTEFNLDGETVLDKRFDTQPAAAASSGMGAIAPFEVPLLGTVDLSKPLEWGLLGGAVASLLLPRETSSKIAGAAGFLGLRYILQQVNA